MPRPSAVDPHTPQCSRAVGPSAPDPDPYFEEYLAAEQFLHIAAGSRSDGFQLASAGADDDGFLPFPVHRNGRVNSAQVSFNLEGIDFDGCRVRQLVAKQAEQLLANRFSREK